jgi:hypothetical protein
MPIQQAREDRMTTLPIWLQAELWGLVAGSGLAIEAAIGYSTRIPHRIIVSIMAFGSGVLISAPVVSKSLYRLFYIVAGCYIATSE